MASIAELERVANILDPREAVDESYIRAIHYRCEEIGRKDPRYMVSPLHRNVVLGAVVAVLQGYTPEYESEEEKPCPMCGCEERGQGGYLRCECPA